MKKAYVLIFDNLADWEIGMACFELNNGHGLEIVTVGLTNAPVKTLGGIKILPDVTLAEVDPQNAAVLILPGGVMDVYLRNDPQLENLLRSFRQNNIVIGGICGGAVYLAMLGLFKPGIMHTADYEDFEQMVPNYEYQKAWFRDVNGVCDQGLVTAQGSAPNEFAYYLAKALCFYDEKGLQDFAENWGCRLP